MEKEIVYENQPFGRAQIEKEDIYFSISARCPFREGIYRLYLVYPSGFTRLGVMFPEKGELTLRRRISAHELGGEAFDGNFVLMPGVQTPSETREEIKKPDPAPIFEKKTTDIPQKPEQTNIDSIVMDILGKKNPEALSEPSDYSIDRWCECSDASAMTTDEVLKPRLFALSGVLYRYRGGGTELAIPADQAGSVSAVLALTRAENIRGKDYFVIALDRDGFPAPAEHPSSI